MRIELCDRQHLIRRLAALLAAPGFGGVGIRADQRRQIRQPQLPGVHRAVQRRPRLTGNVFQVAVNVAVADFAVELLIFEHGAARLMQAGYQMAIGRIRRRVRQQHAGQAIEVTQAFAGKFQLHVQAAEVQRIGQGARHRNPGAAGTHVGLQRERQIGALQ